MSKKERIAIPIIGLLLLTVFTFTDLQISMALFTKNLYGRILEVIGELPFTFLAIFSSGLLFRFRSKANTAINIITALLTGLLFLLFSLMGGMMAGNYLNENLGGTMPAFLPYLAALLLASGAVIVTRSISDAQAYNALTFAIITILYILAVTISMNVIKACWGRMRIREMTDPLTQFTRWYVITDRGGFSNAYASFPSGHSMNSAGVIMITLLPTFITGLSRYNIQLKIISYTWIALVGTSRIVMGAHFASDVTVGILLSLLLFEIIRTIISKLRPNRNGETLSF